MAAVPALPVESQVKRLPWEPRHEWESRQMFVEDHVDAYGMEKAVTLSLVWSNMKFMGCGYPREVEEKVAHYPLPDLATLSARRKPSKSHEGASGVSAKGSKKARDLDEVPARRDGDKPKAQDETDFGENEVERKLLSESVISAQVDALIAAVRKQTESEKSVTKSVAPIPTVLQSIAKAMCLCDVCLGQFNPPVALQQLNQVFTRYKNVDKELVHDFEGTFPKADITYKAWVLKINGVQVGEEVSSQKKTAKNQISEDVLAMMKSYQETHGKPACPKASGGRQKHPLTASQYLDQPNPKRPAMGIGNKPSP